MNKVIRNGQVAILYSPGFGAGWSTWNDVLECIYSPEIVALVEADKHEEITQEYCSKLFNTGYFCAAGASDLEIMWLDEGTQFRIEEYDGYESVTVSGQGYWDVA